MNIAIVFVVVVIGCLVGFLFNDLCFLCRSIFPFMICFMVKTPYELGWANALGCHQCTFVREKKMYKFVPCFLSGSYRFQCCPPSFFSYSTFIELLSFIVSHLVSWVRYFQFLFFKTRTNRLEFQSVFIFLSIVVRHHSIVINILIFLVNNRVR